MKDYQLLKDWVATQTPGLTYQEYADLANADTPVPKGEPIPQVQDWPTFRELLKPDIISPADIKKLLSIKKFDEWFEQQLGTGTGFDTFVQSLTGTDAITYPVYMSTTFGISTDGNIFDNLMLAIMRAIETEEPEIFERSLFKVVDFVLKTELKGLFSMLGLVLAAPSVGLLSTTSFLNIQVRLKQTKDDPDYDPNALTPAWYRTNWPEPVTATDVMTTIFI